jgi:predicted nucleic acid-binding protein
LKAAFWDSSALVPICVRQQATPVVHRLLGRYEVVTWWGTALEIRSALERLLRTGELTPADHQGADRRFARLRSTWREIAPDENLRAEAETLLRRFPLHAADALQLGAAMTWAMGRPAKRAFICGDERLLEAARQLGFEAIEA